MKIVIVTCNPSIIVGTIAMNHVLCERVFDMCGDVLEDYFTVVREVIHKGQGGREAHSIITRGSVRQKDRRETSRMVSI
jgi:hypothetical protein